MATDAFGYMPGPQENWFANEPNYFANDPGYGQQNWFANDPGYGQQNWFANGPEQNYFTNGPAQQPDWDSYYRSQGFQPIGASWPPQGEEGVEKGTGDYGILRPNRASRRMQRGAPPITLDEYNARGSIFDDPNRNIFSNPGLYQPPRQPEPNRLLPGMGLGGPLGTVLGRLWGGGQAPTYGMPEPPYMMSPHPLGPRHQLPEWAAPDVPGPFPGPEYYRPDETFPDMRRPYDIYGNPSPYRSIPDRL